MVRALQLTANGDLTVFEAGKPEPVVACPDDSLRDALARMLKHNVGRLPVVNRQDPRRPVGYLGRGDILAARSRLLQEEEVPERTIVLGAPARPKQKAA